ncbi:hypothetical protein KO481_36280 [Nocardia sp. NEAU-G5]|uniref:PknH-like extracellular domain-containing protein n=1 Tax=Nocardia albiluteola TaxID=2842303 RepID=A0ABS6B9J2_9NOCA|nr:hypothetical protein [Nocardia albiluteola]MBU3066967.1 hypothetical protein [Nocardia albiluteola]
MTGQELQQVANASHASSAPIVLGEPQCKQFWAMAWSVRTAAAPQPAGYLFQATAEGYWRYLAVGTAIDCTSRYGVPADVASALRGCR